jgi:hypothetical protein
MADAKLSALPEAAVIAPTDVVYGVVSGASRRVQAATLLSLSPAADASYLAGGTVVAGDALYVANDGSVNAAKADAAGTADACLIALNGGTLGDTILCRVVGRYTPAADPGWTPGAVLYLSAATAGALTETAPSTPGEYVCAVGRALASDELLLAPQHVPAVVT